MATAEYAMKTGEGWRRYFRWNTDHKVIGVQYMVTALFFFLVGGTLAMLIRTELIRPGIDFLNGELYNQVITNHGSIMVFFWVIPVWAGFGNYFVPLMIGARDMAFPRLNALSYWLFALAALILAASVFVGPAESGWTAYAPLSTVVPDGQTLWALAVAVLGTSSIMGAINFLTTIITMRAEGMSFWTMPLFVWSMLATALLMLIATPMLTAGLILLVFDRMLGTLFFTVQAGGDPILWQNVFWFYSHPAVYIMVLPGMGIISEVLPPFSRKPIFGYKAIALSSMAIAVLGMTVWAHHMFASGMAPSLRVPFMITSMIIAVPTGIKIFSWLATIWGGKLDLKTPMLFTLGFISMFLIGGITGVFQASIPFDLHVHDTYFIVGHLHYVLFGGSVFSILAGFYYWFPKVTGRRYNETLGQLQFYLTFIGANLTYLPMFLLGLQGMPRRVVDYRPELASLNLASSIGAYILGVSVLIFVLNMAWSWLRGPKAAANPWRALTLEWQTTSPPPPENFEHLPKVTRGPYDYGEAPSPTERRIAPEPAGD
jgi:cytochrome c oxidase subunit 1